VERDDSVLTVVRVVAGVIVVVLVLAVGVLYGLPGETESYWAWTIGAPMTPLLMGAGYAAGGYFFTRVLVARSWRSVSLGFPPIAVFTTMLLIATVLHWQNFNHSHVAFVAWVALYAVTPVLVPALWLLNRRREPRAEGTETRVPPGGRATLVLFGLALVILALVTFVRPSLVTGEWPWDLTPLTARTVAAYLALTGATLLLVAVDTRWRSARVLIESLIIGVALILAAIPRAWDTLDPSLAVRWSFAGGLGLALLLLVAFYAGMQGREKGQRPVPVEQSPT
jgi:hypothetical protein